MWTALTALPFLTLAAAQGTAAPPQDEPTLAASEAVASVVQKAMVRLEGAAFGEGAFDSDFLGAPELAGLLAEDAGAVQVLPESDTRWAELDLADGLERAGWTAAVRVEPQLGATVGTDPDSGPEDAALELTEHFAEVAEELGGAPSRPIEWAVKSIDVDPGTIGSEDGEEYDVYVRMRAVREGPPRVLLRSAWVLRVRDAGDAGLQLVATAMTPFERASAPAGARLEDVTASVLPERSTRLLAPGVPDLRRRLDGAVDVGTLGHHGVSVADLNGDGIDDIYLPQPGGVPNMLFVRQPDGTALEAAGPAKLDFLDATTSALFVDLDGDGDQDALFALTGVLQVWCQTPDGFEEVGSIDWPSVTSLAAADVDGDGLLDIYACAYANPYAGETAPVPYHDAENGERNVLFVNRSRARDELQFVDETDLRGLGAAAARFSFSATFGDVDADGDADLYVANDFGRNALYINDGSGFFEERAAELGVQDVAAGMGAAFGDVNGDGRLDLYVSNMESSAGRRVTGRRSFMDGADAGTRSLFRRHAKGSTLFLQQPDGTFEDSGVAEKARWAWGGIPYDLDGDGALDLFAPNGFITGSRGPRPDL